MWQLYVFSFIAGLFGANGVPHFLKGAVGEKFQTPFGKNSSPVINIIWGWFNFVVAFLLLFIGDVHAHLLRSFGLIALGALLMSILNAKNWVKG
jgi:hypothetical protein